MSCSCTRGCGEACACGCCEGTQPITPRRIANRPGLASLRYRIGTHAEFFETMLARLSSHQLEAGRRPLAALSTRDPGDASIALLDAWAIVGDVLTFYQERIANEGFLRTATERRSVLELARLVGYRPRPGVAAGTHLAYTIDEHTREEVVIPQGARVQSVPGPGEEQQSFETDEPLKARATWNQLVPRQRQPQQWDTIATTRVVYLKGVATNLRINDPLLIAHDGNRPELFRVMAVNVDADAKRTAVELQPWEGTAASREFEPIRLRLQKLIDLAPAGATAPEVVERLRLLSEAALRADSAVRVRTVLQRDTLPFVETTLRDLGSRAAPKLRPWLEETLQSLREMRAAIVTAARPAAVGGKPPTLGDRLNVLIKPASRPPSSSLQLSRNLASEFGPTSEAGLQVLGAVSPTLRTNLGSFLSGYAPPEAEPKLEVFALRVRAGVFGRNTAIRQRSRRGRELNVAGAAGDEVFVTERIGEWPIVSEAQTQQGFASTEIPNELFLDASYDSILPGSWVVVDSSAVPLFGEREPVAVVPAGFPTQQPPPTFSKLRVVKVLSVESKVTRAEYGTNGDTTHLTLDDDWLRILIEGPNDERLGRQAVIDRDFQVIRRTAVYVQSEQLELDDEPIRADVCNGADAPLELNGLYTDLEPGRFVVVTGERTDIEHTTGVLASEVAMLAEIVHDRRRTTDPLPAEDPANQAVPLPGDRNHTFVRFEQPLGYCYRRDTVKIYGNVVRASHGATCDETLGSGDGSRALQSFALKRPPLTYLAAPTPVGAESTLQVFVNGVRWHETDNFVDAAATDHLYVIRVEDDGGTTVLFGNGKEGARLPTGVENVKATYRTGIGKGGNVRAGQLSLLATRPLGVQEVINPVRASGGADRESRDAMRSNVPLAIRALDRLVSTRDYADFTRNFAGIGKAVAVELTDGRQTVVHVTIAGSDDVPIDPGSPLFRNLRGALVELGDPLEPVVLAVRDLLLLVVSAGLRIDPDYRWETVVTNVRAALLDAFGFQRRALGEDARSSEVLSVIQAVPGVVYVDLDAFGFIRTMIADAGAPGGRRPVTPRETSAAVDAVLAAGPVPRVRARLADFEGSAVRPAELALLSPEVPATLILNQIR